MQNTSGITPAGDRVLVKPDEVEKVTSGGIIIPETHGERYALAQTIGVVVAIGPDAWIDHVEKDSEGRIVKTQGYSKPFALPGDRVCFAKYGGLQVTGEDGQTYRIINDTDITAKVTEKVDFTDFKPRTSLGR